MENKIEIKVTLTNADEVIEKLEKIKELLNDIKNIDIDVNEKEDLTDVFVTNEDGTIKEVPNIYVMKFKTKKD